MMIGDLTLGLLPAAGGGLASLESAGQTTRLLDYYLPAYLRTFGHLFYFSYHRESLADYTDDPAILQTVSLIPKLRSTPYRIYACQLPLVARAQFQTCTVLRVFQATGAVPAMMARLLYGIPYVTTYGYRYHAIAKVEGRRLASVYLRMLEQAALRMAAGVIVTTRELADYVSHFVPRGRIHLIPNGVDTRLFAPRATRSTAAQGHAVQEAAASVPSGRPTTLLFVGRLVRQKNLFRLLEAASVLARRHALRVQIIGDGPLRRELAAMATQHGLDCTFEGTVPHPRLPDYMNQADLFVLPSLVEGHAKALIEAMSCGLPCVVSACEGNREMVEDGRTGLLFEATDTGQMVSQLERAMEDKALAQELGRAAREQVLRCYDLDRLLRMEGDVLLLAARKGLRRSRW
ncbi:MAG TPA: glycosyltransferase family 4 protein [Anaerolineae bacterium]|nr:glycosyltransferase family 4 protein [Anaerolineae bacterium]